MFDKLKNTVNKIREEDKEVVKKRIDISVISGDEIKNYKKALEGVKENVEAIEDISRDNRK